MTVTGRKEREAAALGSRREKECDEFNSGRKQTFGCVVCRDASSVCEKEGGRHKKVPNKRNAGEKNENGRGAGWAWACED